jgi:hypothetical protein
MYRMQTSGGNYIYVQLFVVLALATFYFTARCVGRKLGRSIGRCCILYYHCVCIEHGSNPAWQQYN